MLIDKQAFDKCKLIRKFKYKIAVNCDVSDVNIDVISRSDAGSRDQKMIYIYYNEFNPYHNIEKIPFLYYNIIHIVLDKISRLRTETIWRLSIL